MDNDILAEIFNEQADWREEKAEQYPDDSRNKDAAELFRELATSAESVPADVLKAAEELFEDVTDQEVWSEMLRQVGFGIYPASATAFVQDFIAARTT